MKALAVVRAVLLCAGFVLGWSVVLVGGALVLSGRRPIMPAVP